METANRTVLCLCLCVGIIVTCVILITLLSGFRHEYKKFKQFVLTVVVIVFIRYIFLDHIVFVLQALLLTVRGGKNVVASHSQAIGGQIRDYEVKAEAFLKLRLQSLKSQLQLPPNHRDETLNWNYKMLTAELWLFGKYFILLLLVVIYSRNPYSYYNTATMRRILNESYFGSFKMEKVIVISDLYYWINDTLTEALNEGHDYDGSPIDEPGWVHFHQSKLLGVVRIQQVRHAKKAHSMEEIHFDEQGYWPGWQMRNDSPHYIDKYWRVYYPWLSEYYNDMTNWLSGYLRNTYLHSYPENNAYEVLLTRHHRNTDKILRFLMVNNWLDGKTAAVFIDFTLYNADSNIFTICSIVVEQTPFGNLLWQINVQSAELLWNMNEISQWWWFLIVLYTFQMLHFCKVMMRRAWLQSGFFTSPWNCVDFGIVLLNLILLCCALLREYYVLHVMKTFILAEKPEYVDFRIACIFNYVTVVVLGFLVCLASVRIWKILQFSSIFRIFNRTLYTSAIPLISTVCGIHVFLFAIGKTAQILNGNHSEIFCGYLKSFTSIMSFSFGFNSVTSPEDLTHGGDVLGFLLYLILMLAVAIFLLNMFITLLCDHFANAREERDREPPYKLTYAQFLLKEYSVCSFYEAYLEKLSCLFNSKSKRQTVRESIHHKIDELEKNLMENHINDKEPKYEDRIQNVAAILNLQMEICERLLKLQFASRVSNSESED